MTVAALALSQEVVHFLTEEAALQGIERPEANWDAGH